MRRIGDPETVLEMAWHFQRLGYTPDELHEATEALMASPPAWPDQHLPKLTAALSGIRRANEAASAPPPADEARCDLCGGCGTAVVPHFAAIARHGGKWHTHAAWCRCPLGLYLAGRDTHDPRLIGLREYEARHPDWREAQREHDLTAARERQIQDRMLRREPMLARYEPLLARLRGREGNAQ